MTNSPSQQIFDSFREWNRLEQLISSGETEGLYYECKSPLEPKFTKDMRVHLAKACSGFGNTNGGIILYGISTTKHAHSGLDVMTQIEPIGNINLFSKQIEAEILSLSNPIISRFQIKVLKEKEADTRGVLLVHVPSMGNDPVQSTVDNMFYFRSGDDFVIAPYDMIKRFFASVQSPNLELDSGESEIEVSEKHIGIELTLSNKSYAVAEHVKCVIVSNHSEDIAIRCREVEDVSRFNKKYNCAFYIAFPGVVHKGFSMQFASLKVTSSAGGIQLPFELTLEVRIFANKMINRRYEYHVSVGIDNSKKVIVKELPED